MKTKNRSNRAFALFPMFSLSVLALLGGCNSADDNPNIQADHADGSTLDPSTPDNPVLPSNPSPTPPPTSSNVITLGVRYVALKQNASDAASPSQSAVQTLLENMNKVWAQCEVRFVLDEYLSPVANDYGLDYTPANLSELDDARDEFDDRTHMLLIKTGTWDRSGTLGYDGSNGFSTLPPANPEGAVFEAWVAASTLLISHEVGHLIGGLGHTTSSTNLMNHYVSASTTQLSSSQCTSARNAINKYHSAWKR